jgi:AcrR family transcriptional regulator
MVQRPKPEVREAILQAAGEVFAEVGFQRAALADIVARAGTSIGNLYKYFANKDELFAAFMPRGFSTELTTRVRAQVEALRSETSVFGLVDDHPYRRASEELLSFTIAHRDRVIFLLLRAQGTTYERFVSDAVRLLVELATDYTRASYSSFAVTSASKRALTRIYRAFVATLGAILVEERAEHALREALALHATYHLSGLKALFVSSSKGEARR